MKILIADDERHIIEIIRDVLQAEGHEVTAVNDGPELYDQLVSGKSFDLVISDVMMPTMTGINAVFNSKTAVPVIFMTGFYEDMVPEGYDFISKPFKIKDLLNALEKVSEKTCV